MERAVQISHHALGAELSGAQRVYLGQEFCDRLIPTPAELEAALAALPPDLPRSLVTPYLSPGGLAAAQQLAERFLHDTGSFDEIVVNDWGLLRCVAGWPGRLVLGRLLLRQLRDPRLSPMAGRQARGSLNLSCGNPPFLDLLQELGFSRLELDVIPDDLDALAARFHLSLHRPSTYVSTTRLCPVAEPVEPGAGRAVPRRCGQECLRRSFVLEEPGMGVPLLLRGNTTFFEGSLEGSPPLAFDRLVWTADARGDQG